MQNIKYQKKKLIVANWKLNKDLSEVKQWFKIFTSELNQIGLEDLEAVICPSFPLLPSTSQVLLDGNWEGHVKLGAQNVSQFEEGPYTGEVSAKQLQTLVDYVILGHSERRKFFNETAEKVAQKVDLCLKYNLIPIICVGNLKELELLQGLNDKFVVAYEPSTAISTSNGQPDTPQHTQKMAVEIKNHLGENTRVIYGGSVDEENIKSYLVQPDIKGALVGAASLAARRFAKLLRSVTQ